MTMQSTIEAGRSGKRTRVLMTAMLMTPTGAHKVVVRDVSRSGALVGGTERLPSNCDAMFKRGSLFAAARIDWSNDHEAGLKFYRELSPVEIEATFHPVVLRTS